MKKLITILLSLIICLSLSENCYANDIITINKTKATIEENNTVQLIVNEQPDYVKWISSNKNVATVTKEGLVKAIKEGKAQITANVSGQKLSCSITVIKATIKATVHMVASHSIVILPTTKTIDVNFINYKLSETNIKVTVSNTDIISCSTNCLSDNYLTLSFETVNGGCADVYLDACYKDGTKEKIMLTVYALDDLELLPIASN
jgi:hypothetical protein